jgi:hypothetical protein
MSEVGVEKSNDRGYEDCVKELMFRKEQLEAIKSSKLPPPRKFITFLGSSLTTARAYG